MVDDDCHRQAVWKRAFMSYNHRQESHRSTNLPVKQTKVGR